MPRIPQSFLDSIFYLYPDEDAAWAGAREGGTGFITTVPSSLPGQGGFAYAVTAAHVVRGSHPAPVIRFNARPQGGWGEDVLDVFPLKVTDWHAPGDDPNAGDAADVAIARLDIDALKYRINVVPEDWYVTQSTMDGELGLGDECFFFGRFFPHEGRKQNLPTVRFGNIAMLDSEPIEPEERDKMSPQESFLVEARSVSGNSGSPVFAYRGSFIGFGSPVVFQPTETERVFFLGVDWCHLPNRARLLQKDGRPVNGMMLEQTAGMIGVIPAWKLRGLLYRKDIVAKRKEEEKLHSDRQREHGGGAVPDSSVPDDQTEFERFEDLARKVVNTPKPDDAKDES